MSDFALVTRMASEVKSLAARATKTLPRGSVAYKNARQHITRPVDYMRFAEFEAMLRGLGDLSEKRILDIASPQWFSLCLAASNPNATFVYVNITEDELDPYREIARHLGLTNIAYEKGDARALKHDSGSFDRVISISVIEHIYPERGGALAALKEVRRLLPPNGKLLLTVPCKAKRNVVFKEGPVHERATSGRNFYAREYDLAMFNELIAGSGLALHEQLLVGEREGFFAIDFFDWGPGKTSLWGKLFRKSRNYAERLFGVSFDRYLAHKYLEVTNAESSRLVNVSAIAVNTNQMIASGTGPDSSSFAEAATLRSQ